MHELASWLSGRYAVLVIGLWLIAAGIGNLAVPQLGRVVENHARSFMPAEAASSIAAEWSAGLFGESRVTTSITLCWNGINR